MRFHSRSGLGMGAVYLVPAFVYAYGWISANPHRYFDGAIALLWAISASLMFILPFFTYWDFGSDVLRERRLWRTKTIPWAEVTYVGPWESASSKWVAIEYERKAPLSDRKR